MNFKIHNLKFQPWNNSCEFVLKVQLQQYATSLIHLRNNTKQDKDKNNYNSNEHKQDTAKGENYLLMDVLVSLLRFERKICHYEPPTMSQ